MLYDTTRQFPFVNTFVPEFQTSSKMFSSLKDCISMIVPETIQKKIGVHRPAPWERLGLSCLYVLVFQFQLYLDTKRHIISQQLFCLWGPRYWKCAEQMNELTMINHPNYSITWCTPVVGWLIAWWYALLWGYGASLDVLMVHYVFCVRRIRSANSSSEPLTFVQNYDVILIPRLYVPATHVLSSWQNQSGNANPIYCKGHVGLFSLALFIFDRC